MMHPIARTDDLLIEEVESELVIYDCRTRQAHRLNPTAAFVYRNCNGNASIGDLVSQFADEFGVAVNAEMVRWSISSLAQAGLIENTSPALCRDHDTSRRAALQKLSMTGAMSVLAPIVATLAAPTPAQAGSGTGRRWGGSDVEAVRKHWVSRRRRVPFEQDAGVGQRTEKPDDRGRGTRGNGGAQGTGNHQRPHADDPQESESRDGDRDDENRGRRTRRRPNPD